MPAKSFKNAQDGSGLSLRQLRVGEEVKRVLADFVRLNGFYGADLEDKIFTFTEVRASPDLRHAWVFVSGANDDKTLKALEKTGPYLRRVLAKKLTLRSVPELHFLSDKSLQEGDRIDSLLKSPQVVRDLSVDSE